MFIGILGVDRSALIAGFVSAWTTYRFLKHSYLCRPPPTNVTPLFPAPGIEGALLGWFPTAMKGEFGAIHKELVKECQAKYGEHRTSYAFVRWPGRMPIVVAHPRDLEHVFLHNANNYVKGPDYNILAAIIGKENLVTIRDEEKHAVQRRMVAPAFNAGTLRHIADHVLRRQVERYLAELAEAVVAQQGSGGGGSIALDTYFDGIALGTVAEAAFKHTKFELTAAAGHIDVQDVFRTLEANSVPFLYLSRLVPFLRPFMKSTREIKRSVRTLRNLALSIAKTARSQHSHASTAAEPSRTDVLISILDSREGNEFLGVTGPHDHVLVRRPRDHLQGSPVDRLPASGQSTDPEPAVRRAVQRCVADCCALAGHGEGSATARALH